MEKIVIVEKCKHCERLMAQRNKAAAAWHKRHPEFQKTEKRRKYMREWMKAYRKRLKASPGLSNTSN